MKYSMPRQIVGELTGKYAMIIKTVYRPLWRLYSIQAKNYFDLFPKTFPAGGPPADLFTVNPRQLRREYRNLQSEHHPDIVMGSSSLLNAESVEDDTSANINKAYSTLRNPYTRAAYIIKLQHPEHLDITQDEVAKKLISGFESDSKAYSLDYKMLLMTVLEAHEAMEMATSESDLDVLSQENDERIEETEKKIEKLLSQNPIRWEAVLIESIRMKYWVNIANGIKGWEPGKPVLLTH